MDRVVQVSCVHQSVFEHSACQPVTVRCPIILPCSGLPLPLRGDRRGPLHPRVGQRLPTPLVQKRPHLCRARPYRVAPSLPVTSRMPHGRCWRRCCPRQHGVAGRVPGHDGCASTPSSPGGAPAVPGALSRGSLRPGQPPRRRSASGACPGSGRASMRRCAAPAAYGQAATPTPRQRCWTARG